MKNINNYIQEKLNLSDKLIIKESLNQDSFKALDISANKEVTVMFSYLGMHGNTSLTSDFTETWRMNL